MIRRHLPYAALSLGLTTATHAVAEVPRGAGAPMRKAESPPLALLGVGAGPAWPAVSDCPYGLECDLPPGLALRGWAWMPMADGVAIGAVGDHLRVPWTFGRTNAFTFVGGGVSFGSGYGPKLALMVWVAPGLAFTTVGGSCSTSAALGAELGIRVDYRVGRGLRAGVSASQGGRGPGGSCSRPSSAQGSPEVVPITSQTFLSIDVTYEWLRAG